jgi:hypothetical protein
VTIDRLDAPRLVAALLPLLLLWEPARDAIDGAMSLHMLGEFPLLAASGWALHRVAERHLPALPRALAWLDWRGWTGATLIGVVTLAWMVPVLLDLSLLSPAMAAAKYASWWIAGLVVAGSVRRMDAEVMLFTVGNVAWMAATAGLLYLDAPTRLCVSYLQEDQRIAGAGLVLLAVLAGFVALRAMVRDARRADASPADGSPGARRATTTR